MNFEFNVECYSAALVSQLHALVDRKIVVSEEVTLEQLENRHLAARLRDGTARLLSPYL